MPNGGHTGSGQRSWALITGEFPPARGGVADYTAQLALALAAAGDTVHVWAPQAGVEPAASANLNLHPVGRHFGWRARRRVAAELEAIAPAPRLLVQYVPQAYGWKGMNAPFCHWAAQRAGVWVMYHEVAYPREPGQAWRHRLLAAVTRRMAAMLAGGAERNFVAIPAWGHWLHELAPAAPEAIWLPVPSNLPTAVSAEEAAAARAGLGAGSDTQLIGWFGGRVSEYTRFCLRTLVPALLAGERRRVFVFAGAGGGELRRMIAAAAPQLSKRLHAPGRLSAAATAAILGGCDLMVQPYPDGLSSRRGSAMASLALGRALLSTAGRLTEPIWLQAQAAALAPAETAVTALKPKAEALLGDTERRAALGAAAQRLYAEHFALACTVRRLREEMEQK